ncbi:hypothetical protein FQR65_LT20337 [Abscondita terminalis]|nr:hypothetical protein FQR65_LT20337 [Abscondita terminalis]
MASVQKMLSTSTRMVITSGAWNEPNRQISTDTTRSYGGGANKTELEEGLGTVEWDLIFHHMPCGHISPSHSVVPGFAKTDGAEWFDLLPSGRGGAIRGQSFGRAEALPKPTRQWCLQELPDFAQGGRFAGLERFASGSCYSLLGQLLIIEPSLAVSSVSFLANGRAETGTELSRRPSPRLQALWPRLPGSRRRYQGGLVGFNVMAGQQGHGGGLMGCFASGVFSRRLDAVGLLMVLKATLETKAHNARKRSDQVPSSGTSFRSRLVDLVVVRWDRLTRSCSLNRKFSSALRSGRDHAVEAVGIPRNTFVCGGCVCDARIAGYAEP